VVQLSLNLQPPPDFRREDFIVSPSNALAVRMIDAWPAWPGGALALVGPPGVGKSHLASLWRERAGAEQVAAAAGVPSLGGRPVLLEVDETPLDDEAMFHLINLAARPSGGLLIVTRTPPRLWPASLPDLKSRLNALPTVEIGEPDDSLLSELLVQLFARRGIRAPADLLTYMAARMERSARAAEALVALIDETASRSGRPIGRSLAREILAADGEADED
jgi:chromosomal replication initiation ATPase DnaA